MSHTSIVSVFIRSLNVWKKEEIWNGEIEFCSRIKSWNLIAEYTVSCPWLLYPIKNTNRIGTELQISAFDYYILLNQHPTDSTRFELLKFCFRMQLKPKLNPKPIYLRILVYVKKEGTDTRIPKNRKSRHIGDRTL